MIHIFCINRENQSNYRAQLVNAFGPNGAIVLYVVRNRLRMLPYIVHANRDSLLQEFVFLTTSLTLSFMLSRMYLMHPHVVRSGRLCSLNGKEPSL